jgi:hypothetical protein
MSKRRTSFSIDEEVIPQTTAERKQAMATESAARKQSAVVEETIPEVGVVIPHQASTVDGNKPLGVSNGKERKNEVTTSAKMEEKQPANGHSLHNHTNGASKAPTTKAVEKPATTKAATKPAPISTAKTTTLPKVSPSKKSPLPKTPTTPKQPKTRDAATMTPEKKPEPEKKPTKKASKATLAPNHTTRPASRPPTAHAHGPAVKTKIPPSPPQTGFHKPRPKSPTKPVKLPASLTAHTASSGSKTANAPPPSRQSLSRASGNIQSGSTRSPSRATTSSKTGPTRNPSTLKSATNRPSLGPPPNNLKKQPSKTTLSSTAPADEGFLARMMRPTTSSASKTAEKAPATPPKRSQSVKRPSTIDGPQKQDVRKRNGSPVHKEVTPKATPKPIVKAPESAKAIEESKVVPAVNKGVKDITEKPIAILPETMKTPDGPSSQIVVHEAEENKAPEPKEKPITSETPVEEPMEEKPEPANQEPNQTLVEESNEIPEAMLEEVVDEKATIETLVLPEAPIEHEVLVTEDVETSVEVEEPVVEFKPIELEVEVEEEDAEDAKAREEIAKLNAEFAKVTLDEGKVKSVA